MTNCRAGKQFILTVASLSLLAFASTAPAATSAFATSVENWRLVTYPGVDYTVAPSDYGLLTYVALSASDGYARRTSDPDNGDMFALAPAKFLGNASASYGSNLTYDLFDVQGIDYNVASAVILKGAGLTLCYTSATLPTTSAEPPFGHFSIPLTQSGWSRDSYNSGLAVTAAQFHAVLGGLTSLAIRMEYHFGADDSGIDNVVLPNLSDVPGDANRNGRIDPDDFTLTDRGFRMSLTGWSNGDFNGDNLVNAADYQLLDGSLAAQHGFSPADVVAPLVPEPTSLAAALGLAIPRLARRRRRAR